MTIDSVSAVAFEEGLPIQIDVVGRAPEADKAEVTLEVTGHRVHRTVTPRNDGGWTARFKASGSTSLRGFACGGLVAARIEADDGLASTEWLGCLDCDSSAESSRESSGDEEPSGAATASPPQEEPGDDERADSDGTDGSGTSQETTERSRPRREPTSRSQPGDRAPERDAVSISPQGDVVVRVPLAVRIGSPTSGPAQSDSRAPSDGSKGEDATDTDEEAQDSVSDDTQQRVGETEPTASRSGEDREERQAYEDSPPSDDSSGTASSENSDESDDPASSTDSNADASDDDSTPWGLGLATALAVVGVLTALASGGIPLLTAGAAGLAVSASAVLAANRDARTWAQWAGIGVGLGVATIGALIPLTSFVQLDVYVVSAAVAAVLIGAGCGAAWMTGGDDDDTEE